MRKEHRDTLKAGMALKTVGTVLSATPLAVAGVSMILLGSMMTIGAISDDNKESKEKGQ